jgi:flagellar basal-body rod protein FlgB
MPDLLEAGLKIANLKQSVIANNLANLETPGYRRSAVSFQGRLVEAIQSGQADLAELQADVVKPMNSETDASGNDVNLDVEIGEMLKNTGQYKLYMRSLAKTYHQIDMAIGIE